MSYKKQELLTLHEHLSSPPVFDGSVLLIFLLCVCVFLLCVFTFYVPCCDVRYDFRIKPCSVRLYLHIKPCSVRLYLQLIVVRRLSYLRCLCLFAHCGIQHKLCCVFALFVFVLCNLYYDYHFGIFKLFLQVSLDCPFGIL